MSDCEEDLGRHTFINLLTENQVEIPGELKNEITELIELIKSENERLLKHIMKVCICSKNGAEYILDEIIDELDKKESGAYYIEKAGLLPLLEKTGISIEEVD